MRENKFRAWDEENKVFHYFTLFDIWKNIKYPSHVITDHKVYYIKDLPIDQYSGFKDKNGKEIYEGDLMKFRPNYQEYEGIYIIQWNPKKAWLSAINAKDKGYDEFDYIYESPEPHEWKDGEVIGNIYENHELVELEKAKPNKKIN